MWPEWAHIQLVIKHTKESIFSVSYTRHIMVITLTNTYKFIDFHLCFHIIFLLYFIYIFTIYHNKNTNWFLELILISLLQSFCFSSVESVQCMRLEGNINPVLITKTGVVKRCSGLISLLWGTKGLQCKAFVKFSL